MLQYTIPMVPGPVSVPPQVLEAFNFDYASADLEYEYVDLYNEVEANLQKLMGTQNKIALMTGEGMIVLWGALKSTLKPGDKVLTVGTGVFGYGIGEMAKAIGADVMSVGTGYDETIGSLDEIEKAVIHFHPKMITAVHCETPSGTLNPLAELGALKQRLDVPLFYVDAVASIGGCPVEADAWNIDLLLGGTQKAVSAPPNMSFVSISEAAWKIIREVNYPGYDALLPFLDARKNFYFPYTMYWQGTAALKAATDLILKEGLEDVFARHERNADYCRKEMAELGYELYPKPGAVNSPTVSAFKVPESRSWKEFNDELLSHGLGVGGSYGPLANKIFRVGHMGSQSSKFLLDKALEVLAKALH